MQVSNWRRGPTYRALGLGSDAHDGRNSGDIGGIHGPQGLRRRVALPRPIVAATRFPIQ
jgi:hypothetical protein